MIRLMDMSKSGGGLPHGGATVSELSVKVSGVPVDFTQLEDGAGSATMVPGGEPDVRLNKRLSQLFGFGQTAVTEDRGSGFLRIDAVSDASVPLTVFQLWCQLTLTLCDLLDPWWISGALYALSISFFFWSIKVQSKLDPDVMKVIVALFCFTYAVIWRSYFSKYQGTDFKFSRQASHFDLI